MIELSEKGNVLFLRDYPIGHWIGSSLSILVLVIFVGVWFFDTNDGSRSVSVLAILFWIYLLIMIVYYGRATHNEVKVDREMRTISVSKRGIFQKRYNIYSFNEIEGGALLITRQRSEKTTYAIDLLMKGTKTIPLVQERDSDGGAIVQAAHSINRFLGIEESLGDFRPTILEED